MTDSNNLFARFETVVRNEIPRLNTAIESGDANVQMFTALFNPWLFQIKDSMPENMTVKEARKVIQLLGFIVGSLERHEQSKGLPPGYALKNLNGIDDFLIRLSLQALHPPRDTHYTYWLWNDGENPITFTGDPQETFFNRAVNHTHVLHTASCDLLRPICAGQVEICSPEALLAMEIAKENTMQLYEHFRSFMAKDNILNRRAVEPHFFMTRMRTYLPTYPIKDQVWTGVNAANLNAQMQLDYLIGTIVKGYNTTVIGRFPYLTSEDRNKLQHDMSLSSLFDILLREMLLTPADVESLSEDFLAANIAGQSSDLRTALIAYVELVEASGRLSAVHWALIQNYLVKAAAALTAEEKVKLSVSPDQGTGGKSHQDTEAIMHMRRRHPLIGKIASAIDLLEKHPIAG